MEWLGIGCAFATTVLFGVGIVLQARAARMVSRAHAMRVELLVRLAGSRGWLLGTALTAAGWALQALALGLAPLTVVQPVLAFTLAVVLVLARTVLDEDVRAREIVAVLVLAAGVATLVLSAPSGGDHHTHGARLLVPLAILGLVAGLPLLLRRVHATTAGTAALAAGCAFALCGIATKLFADAAASRAWVGVALWLALAGAAAAIGGVAEMSAFQAGRTTQVVPITFGAEIAVPVALAPLLFLERWNAMPPARATVFWIALGAILASVAALASAPGVATTVAPRASSA